MCYNRSVFNSGYRISEALSCSFIIVLGMFRSDALDGSVRWMSVDRVGVTLLAPLRRVYLAIHRDVDTTSGCSLVLSYLYQPPYCRATACHPWTCNDGSLVFIHVAWPRTREEVL